MNQPHPSLGLCFFENKLFYAVNEQQKSKKLARIGCVDFNFDVANTIISGNSRHFPGIQQTVNRLKQQFDIRHIRILSPPHTECWTILPKLVYDNADEREDHINILMSGIHRSRIHPSWYTLSNQDYKFLLLRDEEKLQGLKKLAPSASTTDFISEFEIGERWINHTNAGGSFMTVCCFKQYISVASFILGKLRGATYLTFDEAEDLPYLWLQQARQHSWMQGLHEKILVYGTQAYHIIDILEPFWDEAGTVQKMDSVETFGIKVDEQTYGFNLEQAFPAVLMALD